MRRLITTSKPLNGFVHRSVLHSTVAHSFSTIPNIAIQKAIEYQYNFRTIVKFSDLHQYVMKQAEGIKKYGKTILLEFLNEYPMQSFRRARDELNFTVREQKKKIRLSLYLLLNEFQGLNFYQKNMRYVIFKKMVIYYGNDPIMIKKCEQYETQLLHIIKTQTLHINDLINWLYMLPLDYPSHFSVVAFDQFEKYLEKKQIREYLKAQRSFPMLLKRICEVDWNDLRKYKNLIRFLCYEATDREIESIEESSTMLERLCSMKLHKVGERVIPKIIDEMMDRFSKDFANLEKNKMTLLKVFSCFRHMPLNYNRPFFDKIHSSLRLSKDLPSHCLLMLPYNKLSQGQVTFIQTKIFSMGREDIATKLIYTVYEPYFKDLMTPLLVKQAYESMLEIWKKDNLDSLGYFQVYIALIFRFMKMKHSFIDLKRLKSISQTIADRLDESNYDFFSILSYPGILAFYEVCHHFNLRIDQTRASQQTNQVISTRKERNTVLINSQQYLHALQVHYNANGSRTRRILTQFIHEMANHPDVPIKYKSELLFLIEKSSRPEPSWVDFSSRLFSQNMIEIEGFVESFIKYDYKTLKLANFIFAKLYEKKVDLTLVVELLASLNLKLITSLKGKLISPLRKYINQLDPSTIDLSKPSHTSLSSSFKLFFYFRNEIPEFMEYMAISLINKIQQKIISEEAVNGKQFALLSIYVMEVLAHTDIKQKTEVIEKIVSIIKMLRKKEGLYMKVWELDFLCSNQKHIKINNEVLDHHALEIVATLKKTQRIEHHRDLYFIVLKLHCRGFVELNTFELRYFIDKCTQLVEDSILDLPNIKQCLGYEILNCDDDFVIQKLRLYMSNIVKLAFRKVKGKQNYFMYEYFLKLFSKLESTDMVAEICSNLLYEKLYPIEVSNIVPILNKNQIKNKNFANRIINIILLSDAYVTFERMQVISWLEKIMYELPNNDANITLIKEKIDNDMFNKIKIMKEHLAKVLQEENRSHEDMFEVEDPQFDKNYKIFIDYAWSCLKSKNSHNPVFKFICRYLYFSIDKIKARIQNPIERKQISKIKLYHLMKYIKQCGFFDVNSQKIEEDPRKEASIKQKQRKNRLLIKMEGYLNVMKLQTCEKLQKRLQKIEGLSFSKKVEIKQVNRLSPHIAEYLINERLSNHSTKKQQFIILTVKKYHCTPEIDIIETAKQQMVQRQKQSRDKSRNTTRYESQQEEKSPTTGNEFGDASELEAEDEQFMGVLDIKNEKDMQIEETDLMSDLNSGYSETEPRGQKQAKVIKPLFGAKKTPQPPKEKPKAQKKEEKKAEVKVEEKKFITALKLETTNQEFFKDYNGYLKVEKSLIELITGLKCIIYDPDRDVFFD